MLREYPPTPPSATNLLPLDPFGMHGCCSSPNLITNFHLFSPSNIFLPAQQLLNLFIPVVSAVDVDPSTSFLLLHFPPSSLSLISLISALCPRALQPEAFGNVHHHAFPVIPDVESPVGQGALRNRCDRSTSALGRSFTISKQRNRRFSRRARFVTCFLLTGLPPASVRPSFLPRR